MLVVPYEVVRTGSGVGVAHEHGLPCDVSDRLWPVDRHIYAE